MLVKCVDPFLELQHLFSQTFNAQLTLKAVWCFPRCQAQGTINTSILRQEILEEFASICIVLYCVTFKHLEVICGHLRRWISWYMKKKMVFGLKSICNELFFLLLTSFYFVTGVLLELSQHSCKWSLLDNSEGPKELVCQSIISTSDLSDPFILFILNNIWTWICAICFKYMK